eukprot:1237413-Prymnesium_polylepis.1
MALHSARSRTPHTHSMHTPTCPHRLDSVGAPRPQHAPHCVLHFVRTTPQKHQATPMPRRTGGTPYHLLASASSAARRHAASPFPSSSAAVTASYAASYFLTIIHACARGTPHKTHLHAHLHATKRTAVRMRMPPNTHSCAPPSTSHITDRRDQGPRNHGRRVHHGHASQGAPSAPSSASCPAAAAAGWAESRAAACH